MTYGTITYIKQIKKKKNEMALTNLNELTNKVADVVIYYIKLGFGMSKFESMYVHYGSWLLQKIR